MGKWDLFSALLGRLEAAGLIRPCDPAVVAARIKRADRRPKGWDLDLTRIRVDLAEDEVAVLERRFPGLAARLAASTQPGDADAADGVQPLHPAVAVADAAVHNAADGVQRSHPAPGTGCNQRTAGVQPVQPRGAVVAPEPILGSIRGTVRRPRAHARSADCSGWPGCRRWAGWGVLRRARLGLAAHRGPAGQADPGRAVGAGRGLDAAGASGIHRGEHQRCPQRVRSARGPALARRTTAPRPAAARPPWCGECDQDTRMLDFDGDTPRRCPRCKPSAVMNRTPLAEPISIRDLGGAGFHRAQHGVVRFEDFMPGPGKR